MNKDKDISSLRAYIVAVSISCGICAEISPNGDIRRDQAGHGGDPAKIVPAKRRGDHRGTCLPGPYPHADKHTAQVVCGANHGVLER